MKKYDSYTNFLILMMIMIICAIIGFIFESALYSINEGKYILRGNAYGPWLPMFGIGGLLIVILTHKLKKQPALVFLVSSISCGIFEYLTGYYLLHYKGLRLWDYRNEKFNFGSIDGFVCLKSVLFFGLAGLLIIYLLVPLVKKIEKQSGKTVFSFITLISLLLFISDIVINYILK